MVHNKCIVHGNAHGSDIHKIGINKKTQELIDSNQYSDIWLNKQLNTAGLKGTQRPDIIAKRLDGTFEYYEFASVSQRSGNGLLNLKNKMKTIDATNGMKGILYLWGEY